MDGQHIGQSGKNRTNATIKFRSLAMDNIRLDLLEFLSRRPNAAQVKRPHPTELRYVETVKERIRSHFFGRNHRHSGARDHMDFKVGKVSQSLEQCFRRGAKI